VKWILILVLSGSGKAIHHIEFDNMEACEYAATKVSASKTFTYYGGSSICVPKKLP
jgi:hypothetical protein